MQTLTLKVPESLLDELQPCRDNLAGLLMVGLRQVKLESALALFKRGGEALTSPKRRLPRRGERC